MLAMTGALAAGPAPAIELRTNVTLRRNRIRYLLFAGLVPVAAACAEESGDDATPEPFMAARCALYWARENPDGATLDVFALDLPAASWATGPGTYGAGRRGWFAYATPDGSLSAAAGLAVVTAGQFSLTVAGTDAGDAVSFVDGTAQALVDARVASNPPAVGTGGAGSFDGVWSDPGASEAALIDWAAGATMTVTWLGSSITLGGGALGGMSAYGQCYSEDLAARGPGSGLEPQFLSGTRKGSR